MATKEFKNQKVELYKKQFENAKVAVVADYRGLSVEEITELRRSLQANEADLTVDHKGNEVTMKERCDSVAERYGVDSQAHSNIVKMSQKIIEFKENNK